MDYFAVRALQLLLPPFRLTCGLAVHAHAPVPGVGERPAFGSTSSHADLLWLRFHAFTSAYPGFRIPHEMMHAKTSFDGSSFISSFLVVSCFALEDERRRLCLLTDLSDLTTNPKDISFCRAGGIRCFWRGGGRIQGFMCLGPRYQRVTSYD